MKNVLMVALLIGLGISGCISKKLLNKPIDTNRFTVIELGKDSVFFVITFKDGRKTVKSKPIFQTAGYSNFFLNINDIYDEYPDLLKGNWSFGGIGNSNCRDTLIDGRKVLNCTLQPPIELNKVGLVISGPVLLPPDNPYGILGLAIFIKQSLPLTLKKLIYKR